METFLHQPMFLFAFARPADAKATQIPKKNERLSPALDTPLPLFPSTTSSQDFVCAPFAPYPSPYYGYRYIHPEEMPAFFDTTTMTRTSPGWELFPAARDPFGGFGPRRSMSLGRRMMDDVGFGRRHSEPWDGFAIARDMALNRGRMPLLRSQQQRHRETRVSERYVYHDRDRGVRLPWCGPRDHVYSRDEEWEYYITRDGRRERRKRKLANGLEAAVDAAAIEAFRLRNRPGSWISGEKVSRIATSALSAGAIEGLFRNSTSDNTWKKLTSAAGGLLVNRVLNGPRSNVGRDREW